MRRVSFIISLLHPGQNVQPLPLADVSCPDPSSNAPPTFHISDFSYSEAVTGGSEASLSRVIDMSFGVTNSAVSTSSVTACTIHDSLDQGQTWDAKTMHACSGGGAQTQFAFDSSNNNLTIVQSWTCNQPSGNAESYRAAGSGIVPLTCKVHNATHEAQCDMASATIRGVISRSIHALF